MNRNNPIKNNQVGYALVSPQKTKNVIEESKSVAEKVRGFISIMTLTFRI
mgnify:CR=1